MNNIEAKILKPDPENEFITDERCRILESWNNETDEAVSIARARVAPGVTTQLHRINGADERYLIVEGEGIVKIGSLLPEDVKPGNVIVIPAGVAQQISNTDNTDLVFYCICTPRFKPERYESLE